VSFSSRDALAGAVIGQGWVFWVALILPSCLTLVVAWPGTVLGLVIRAHELGHNLGLKHGGGDDAGRRTTFVEYGDPTAAMGASYRFSSYIASSRFFLGVLCLGEGGVVDSSNGADKPLTLGSKSLPLRQVGAEAVAIRISCSTCVPKVSGHAHNKGGYVWLSFLGDEGYSAIQNRGLEERFQNKIYVHLAREFSNLRINAASCGKGSRWGNITGLRTCSRSMCALLQKTWRKLLWATVPLMPRASAGSQLHQ